MYRIEGVVVEVGAGGGERIVSRALEAKTGDEAIMAFERVVDEYKTARHPEDRKRRRYVRVKLRLEEGDGDVVACANWTFESGIRRVTTHIGDGRGWIHPRDLIDRSSEVKLPNHTSVTTTEVSVCGG